MRAKPKDGKSGSLRLHWYLHWHVGNSVSWYRRLGCGTHATLRGVPQLLSAETLLKEEANNDAGVAIDGLSHLRDIGFITFEPLVDPRFELVTAPHELLKSEQTPAPSIACLYDRALR